MENKGLSIGLAQQQIGWAYPDLKWLTEKEQILANRKRDGLLRSLSNEVSHSFMQNKLHIGGLSPGCVICGQGYWSCMFINTLCTRHCFYCPQDRKIKQERAPNEEGGLIFDDPGDYVDYLQKFDFRGVGFSGGEALLVFKKLLVYIKEIRKRLGREFYLWVYTNGDLVNRDKLRRLKEAGLNEIRFNISAGSYNLYPVELAVKIIGTVAVEIPAIPEDYEIVKRSLVRIKEAGVKFFNIHQLTTTVHNYKNYIRRGYTFLHHPSIPILESEMAALELIRHALDKRIALAVNYCSQAYKDRLQSKGKRERLASLIKEDFEVLTGAGYIRSLSIQDSPVNIKRIEKVLREEKCQDNFTISYFEPQLKVSLNSEENGKEAVINSKKRIFIKKELVARQDGLSRVAMRTFLKLFIENIKDEEALSYLYRNYNLKTEKELNSMREETGLLMSFKRWERLEAGFPEIY